MKQDYSNERQWVWKTARMQFVWKASYSELKDETKLQMDTG